MSAQAAETRLQSELEVLREKKREEDIFRGELRGKTRELEEIKRVAEVNRLEAERELGERKSVMRRHGERIGRVKEEIAVIERREVEAIERKDKKKRDRKEREKKLKEELERRKEDLVGVEAGVSKVLAKAAGLAKTIEARKEILMAKRNDYSARTHWVEGSGMGDGVHSSSSSFRRGLGPSYSRQHSRPASLNSDHFDYYTGPYDRPSVPPSPTLSHQPIPSPHPSEQHNYNPSNLSDAADYAGSFAPNAEKYRGPPPPGFLEHRTQHRREEYIRDSNTYIPNTYVSNSIPETLPSVDDIPANFLPFDFDSNEVSPIEPLRRDEGNASSLGAMGSKRPQLSLPLQYLDTGLLAGGESPGAEGPLSPMTPHQASLIPSQLFQMLDEDEDDFDMMNSPSKGRSTEESDLWSGLGLDNISPSLASSAVMGLKARERGATLTPPPVASPLTNYDATGGSHAREYNPWERNDQMPHSRGSPFEEDDLPRHELSLNPGAKSFASLRPQQLSSPPFPALSGSSSTPTSSPKIPFRSSSPSVPVSSVFNNLLADPQPKSRMEFAKQIGSSSTVAPAGQAMSRFSHEWQRQSPRPGARGILGHGLGSGSGSGGFSPFDADELLGPLKQ